MRNLTIKAVTSILVLTISLVMMAGPALAQTSIVFTADRQTIKGGECVNIFWDVRNVQQVYYNGAPVAGENQTRNECPGQTVTPCACIRIRRIIILWSIAIPSQ